MPYVLTGRWPFGRGLCKLWLVVDYLLCTSSVFNIVLISYDRFLSVTRAVSLGCGCPCSLSGGRVARGGKEMHQAGVRPLLNGRCWVGLGSAHLRHSVATCLLSSHLPPVGLVLVWAEGPVWT